MTIETDKEPECGQGNAHHDWYTLGQEDSGETVRRCNHCLTLHFVDKEGRERWEDPRAPDPAPEPNAAG